MTERLDELRRTHKEIADYENRTQRSDIRCREVLGTYLPMVHAWNSEAAHADIDESSPLVPVVKRLAEAAGVHIPSELSPNQGKAPAAPKTPGKKKSATSKAPAVSKTPEKKKSATSKSDPATKKTTTPKADTAAAPAETIPPADMDSEEGDKLLSKGDWLKSHADIIRKEIPKVKAEAGDMQKYAAAKRAFLKRNIPKLEEYIANPKKGHSPLFAYCALYRFDTGDLAGALKLCDSALELLQGSPIKRNFHELQFDIKLMHLESEAERIAGTGEAGEDYTAMAFLREELMKSPFRSNHAKAKVCKIYGTLAFAVGDHHAAKSNLLQVKFLDPNMGVDTLLAKVDAALSA